MSPRFHKGDQVEVIKLVNGVNSLTYFSATVLASPSPGDPEILVHYTRRFLSHPDSGELLTEVVDLACLRPVPPKYGIECFELGDSVDVFCDNGWQKGTVKDLLGNSMYVVGFDGKSLGIVVEQCNLRLHRDWDDGSWFPPFGAGGNKNSLEKEVKPRKFRVKFKCRKREREPEPEPEPLFRTGTKVEVRSDEEGFIGAWFDATVVRTIGIDSYVVEYLNLLTDDESAPAKEMVTSNNIRPCPPLVLSELNFQQFEFVDAWFNDGWWEGVIYKVLDESKYAVYFSRTNEIMEFEHSSLRHHQDWIKGVWKKKGKLMTLGDRKRRLSETFRIGTKVEVRSNEDGFQGAWFVATIVNETESGKLVVQYDDLLTEDGADHLKEEANASDVRPIPPPMQLERSFRLCEIVDARYNDGWWVGRVNRVRKNSKYTVQFISKEELDFEHAELRPHRDYIDGEWVIASKDWQW